MAMENDQWMKYYDISECIFQTPVSSDHSPGVIRLGGNIKPTFFAFKYCNMWAKDEKFQ